MRKHRQNHMDDSMEPLTKERLLQKKVLNYGHSKCITKYSK